MAYLKRRNIGRPVSYKTWFGLWMDMRCFSIDGFGRAVLYSAMAIKRWRAGGAMGRHAAQLIRARYPEAPILLLGGRVPSLKDTLPINARTPEIYRFLMRKMNVIDEGKVASKTLDQARGITMSLKPK